MIRLFNLKSWANSSFFSILQMEVSIVGTEILNLELIVLPPSNNKIEIPFDATFKIIYLLERNAVKMIFYMNI